MRITPIKSTVAPSIAPTVRAPLTTTSGFAQGLGQLGAAIGETGIAAGQISRVLREMELKKKLVDDSVFLTNLENKANLSYAEHHEDLRSTPDYNKIDEIDKTGLEARLKQFNDEASAMNPEVAAAWKETGAIINIKAQISGMPIKRDRFKQNAIAGAFTLMNSRRDEAVEALIIGNTERANAIFQEINEAVDFLRDNLGISALSAKTWKSGFEKSVETEKTLQETAFKKQLQEAETKAAKKKEDEQKANFGAMVVSYSNGELTEERIRGLIKTRSIDPGKGMAMITRLRTSQKDEKEPDENNPVIVGRLASDIELGFDVDERLYLALTNGDIKSETYITLKAKLGDRDFKQGMNYVSRALKPSQADKWTPDRHVRFAEAIDDYQARVGQGQNPIDVAREIVDLNIGHIRRTILGLRIPRFLTGEKTNLMDLALAKTVTVGKYQAGELTIEEFNREAILIKQLEDLVGELSGGESLGTEMSGRIKQSKDLRNR
ncbi:MAG: hypothetical protein JRC90_11285 [Deltaproteobacteria bacterium]|nr:hypothetical protein [Deltaproteobacteria bacterium]